MTEGRVALLPITLGPDATLGHDLWTGIGAGCNLAGQLVRRPEPWRGRLRPSVQDTEPEEES